MSTPTSSSFPIYHGFERNDETQEGHPGQGRSMNQDLTQTLAAQVASAQAEGRALRIQGGGSKTWLGRAVCGEPLTVGGHRGILSYEPTELVITARAGTPWGRFRPPWRSGASGWPSSHPISAPLAAWGMSHSRPIPTIGPASLTARGTIRASPLSRPILTIGPAPPPWAAPSPAVFPVPPAPTAGRRETLSSACASSTARVRCCASAER